jgi:hypothetical protein
MCVYHTKVFRGFSLSSLWNGFPVIGCWRQSVELMQRVSVLSSNFRLHLQLSPVMNARREE